MVQEKNEKKPEKSNSRLKKITTCDGSTSFYDSEFDESHHSKSGALEEADKKYAKVCGIEKRKSVSILDICFGLGYNTAAAIDSFKGDQMSVTALEIYDGIVDEIWRMGDEYPFKCKEKMQELARNKLYQDDKIQMKLIMGDAKRTIIDLKDNQFDVVFLDPFSPKKCPDLWTEEFFKEIFRVVKKNAIIATYSCARIVRDNLKAAGFEVKDGPIVGRRGPGTIAIKL